MKEDYEFGWDEAKAKSNAQKHGVSFEDAKAIWDDPMFVEVHLQSATEDGWAAIGQVAKEVFLIAIVTYRDDRVRIISARRATKKETSFMARISNEELERRFDEGEDITEFMDVATIRHPNQKRAAKRISMDVPEEMVRGLDKAALRMGVNRQAVIKIWLTERLDQEAERELARAGKA